jgi:enoyl-CoA hydratase
MKYEHLRLELDEGVATVTLDRPPVNAMDHQTRAEVTHVFDMLSERRDARVVILTGAGRAFSAGADMKERVGISREDGEYLAHNRQARETFLSIMDCAKPVIAAVNGAALGAGLALMFASDIMLASENAFIGMPEVDVGLSGGQWFLMEHFSRSRARMMYYTGRRVPAAELYRLGVIEACLPPEKLMPEAMQIAREIAAKSPSAIAAGKRAFDMGQHLPYRVAYPMEQNGTRELSGLPDTIEAQRAFLEKRKPVFKG